MTQVRYFVGLGANLGDRLTQLRSAAAELGATAGVELLRRSGIWETRPLGPGEGPFLNAAVEIRTSATAVELLDVLLAIERRHGRIRRERWGDRTLDLDLLCGFDERGDELVVEAPPLSLPHPELARRDFVLAPLVEIEPELRSGGRECRVLLAELEVDQRTLLRRLDSGWGPA